MKEWEYETLCHRGIKRITKHALGFKEFYSASVTLNGIEFLRILKNGQMENLEKTKKNTAELFYSWASYFIEVISVICHL